MAFVQKPGRGPQKNRQDKQLHNEFKRLIPAGPDEARECWLGFSDGSG